MRTMLLLPLAIAVPIVSGMHDAGCVPTQAEDPHVVDVGDDRYYVDCRYNPFGSPPHPIYCVISDGVWVYREANGIDGLQRGGVGLVGSCFPPEPFPCIIIDEDPINDQHCGHGPDELIF